MYMLCYIIRTSVTRIREVLEVRTQISASGYFDLTETP